MLYCIKASTSLVYGFQFISTTVECTSSDFLKFVSEPRPTILKRFPAYLSALVRYAAIRIFPFSDKAAVVGPYFRFCRFGAISVTVTNVSRKNISYRAISGLEMRLSSGFRGPWPHRLCFLNCGPRSIRVRYVFFFFQRVLSILFDA